VTSRKLLTKPKILNRTFYDRGTRKVARELLGKRLVHIVKGRRISGIIVETEAYLGSKDRAAHTFGGRRTQRNEVMWGEGGHAYVYFIYGMHYCINAVAKSEGIPEAVLIRALEPDEGIDFMMRARRHPKISVTLTNGPGKLCEALAITREENGADLTIDRCRTTVSSESQGDFNGLLFIEDTGLKVPAAKIISGPRIGVDYAEEAKHWPLRFCVRGNPFVSKPWPPEMKLKNKALEPFRNL
jgi:DNA-3-methyladenine glycosylase